MKQQLSGHTVEETLAVLSEVEVKIKFALIHCHGVLVFKSQFIMYSRMQMDCK